MEELIKKVLRMGIHSMISVTEELRYALSVLEKDLEKLRQETLNKRAAGFNDETHDLLEHTLKKISEYGQQAAATSRELQNYLTGVDSATRQGIEALVGKLQQFSAGMARLRTEGKKAD
ncbi:MAG: hypothetical protein NZL89_06695 [Leptospiraceae bacterium]|nr:hypothetical protein [Leptospiraceae bacterium]